VLAELATLFQTGCAFEGEEGLMSVNGTVNGDQAAINVSIAMAQPIGSDEQFQGTMTVGTGVLVGIFQDPTKHCQGLFTLQRR